MSSLGTSRTRKVAVSSQSVPSFSVTVRGRYCNQRAATGTVAACPVPIQQVRGRSYFIHPRTRSPTNINKMILHMFSFICFIESPTTTETYKRVKQRSSAVHTKFPDFSDFSLFWLIKCVQHQLSSSSFKCHTFCSIPKASKSPTYPTVRPCLSNV